MRNSLPLSILTFLIVTSGAPLAAGAGSTATKRTAMEKAAKKACITGDVRRGIDILGDLL
jgi:hypothetical protein